MSIKDPPVIPDWMSVINPNAYIGANDVAEIFHVRHGDITHHIRRGRIPPPDKKGERLGKGLPKNHWKLDTIKEFINANT